MILSFGFMRLVPAARVTPEAGGQSIGDIYLPTTLIIRGRHRLSPGDKGSATVRIEANSDGVMRCSDLNCRQKWEGCLKPRSNATFFTESPDSNRSRAASSRRSFN